ncbi:PA14 domain-containing protein [Cladophialophora immunda]|nr:PA14 domain-containing protein [Cladophialophora immunda]
MGDAGQRLESILQHLTLPETISLLSGKDAWHTASIPHRGIPSIRLSDGPSGVRGRRTFQATSTTCFPCPIALAATWDVNLVKEIGTQMAGQAKAQGVHGILTPTINIQRSPLGGRNFECFSEDPVLSGSLASSLVSSIQHEGIATTVKHFVCNDQETHRTKIDVIVEERALREIYLKPFQIVVRNAQPWAIMASYNRVNGLHVSENPLLLDQVLRKEWGWDGAIISDWFATYSTSEALKAGLDLEMPGKTEWRGKLVMRSLHAGKIEAPVLQERARNVLNLVDKTRASGVPEDAEERENNTPEVKEANRKAATESVVLLKNSAQILPIKTPGRVAIIGPNATEDLFCGGGSSIVFPYYYVSAYDGIKQALAEYSPSSELAFAQGCYKHALLPLLCTESASGQKGLDLEFFDRDFTQVPDAQKVAETHSLTWRLVFLDSLPKEALPNVYGRLRATYTAPSDGDFEFGIVTTGKAKLYIDGVLLVDNWTKQESGTFLFGLGTKEVRGTMKMTAGRQYEIVTEYSNISSLPNRTGTSLGGGILRVGVCRVVSPEALLNDALEAAALADTVICCVGTDQEHESEGWDRKDMKLPGTQDQLVEAVLKVNPRTIIVNISGSPVEMPWIDEASTVVQGWFMGSELGNALADVLFGRVSPSGKLPVTFPRRLEQNPAYGNFPGENGRVRYAEGILVGYRHYSTRHVPSLFPFGHGLSFTEFQYSELSLEGDNMLHPEGVVSVSLMLKNTGSFAGHETVQLYVSALNSSVFRPLLELQGFQKIRDVQPGESREVTFKIDKYAVSCYDESQHKWMAEAGKYRVSVGASVEDLRLATFIQVPATFHWSGV